MHDHGLSFFDTAFGRCGIAWGAAGVRAIQLPDADAGMTRERLLRRAPGAVEAPPPAPVRSVIDAVCAMLRGESVELEPVPLDMRGIGELPRRVYAIARGIAHGSTLSYGEVAARLGDPTLARAVGQALARNPFAPVVPCHRVLAADGRPGGFSASGGVHTKLRLLHIEGAAPHSLPDLFSPARPPPLPQTGNS